MEVLFICYEHLLRQENVQLKNFNVVVLLDKQGLLVCIVLAIIMFTIDIIVALIPIAYSLIGVFIVFINITMFIAIFISIIECTFLFRDVVC